MLEHTHLPEKITEIQDFSTHPFEELKESSIPNVAVFRSPVLGNGLLGAYSIKSDLHYFYLKCTPVEDVLIRSNWHEEGSIYFNFIFQASNSVQSTASQVNSIEKLSDNVLIIDNTNAEERSVQLKANTPFEIIQVTFSNTRFNEYMERYLAGYSSTVRQQCIDSFYSEEQHGLLIPIDVRQQQCLMELLNCPFGPSIRPHFAELKICEILLYYFQTFADGSIQKLPLPVHFTLRDRNTVLHIKQQIDTQLDELKLEDVADEHKVSISWLKNAFKSVLGISIIRYHRKHRLNQAYKLLLDANQNLSVKEVGYQTGFNSVQSFSRCFFNAFKLRPSDVKANSR